MMLTCVVASRGECLVVVVLVFWGSGWECFQFSARLGACFARKAERTAWRGAEVNSRLPDQGVEALQRCAARWEVLECVC